MLGDVVSLYSLILFQTQNLPVVEEKHGKLREAKCQGLSQLESEIDLSILRCLFSFCRVRVHTDL